MGHYRRSAAALVAAQAGSFFDSDSPGMIDCTCPQFLVSRDVKTVMMVAAARMGEQAFCRCILALGAAFALVMLFLCLN